MTFSLSGSPDNRFLLEDIHNVDFLLATEPPAEFELDQSATRHESPPSPVFETYEFPVDLPVTERKKPNCATVYGRRIRELRKSIPLKQIQLAAKANVDQRIISEAENGRHELRYEPAVRIAKVLGAKAEELMPYDDFIFGQRVADKTKIPLGIRLKNLRKKLDRDEKSLSKLSGMSVKAINYYEKGQVRILLSTVKCIASALNLTLEQVCRN